VTGLYYFHARWYDPQAGRFVSTASFPRRFEHPYAICENDVINHSDPFGMRRPIIEGGEVCVDKNCKKSELEKYKYKHEDNNTLVDVPLPGNCTGENADGLYLPCPPWDKNMGIIKIGDTGKCTIVCEEGGCVTEVKCNVFHSLFPIDSEPPGWPKHPDAP
jgi:hypothetical protein